MLAKRRLGPLELVFTHRSKSLEKVGKESRINLRSWHFFFNQFPAGSHFYSSIYLT